jgi:2-dehydro-3-deoxyphosphooctonate aldolase (KDO 8-P synthase)
MQQFGYPVGLDATHAVQLPGGSGTSSSGQRQFVETLAIAYLAAGSNFLFLESHENPDQALSDRDSQISFAALPKLLERCKRAYHFAQGE